jgi:hypothetical protein
VFSPLLLLFDESLSEPAVIGGLPFWLEAVVATDRLDEALMTGGRALEGVTLDLEDDEGILRWDRFDVSKFSS